MFCPNCGTKLEDGAMLCSECGCKLQEVPAAEEEVPAAEEEVPAAEEEVPAAEVVPVVEVVPAVKEVPVKNGSNKGLLMGIIAGVAAVFFLMLIAVICLIVGRGGGYEKPLKSTVKMVNKQSTDMERYVDTLLPDFMVDAYHDALPILQEIDGYDEAMEDAQDALADVFDNMGYDYGEKWKLTYEIIDKEQLDKQELKEIKSHYKELKDILVYLDEGSYFYDMLSKEVSSKAMNKYDKLLSDLKKDLKDIKITDGYVLDVELTIEGAEDYDDAEIEVYVIKMNGKWVIDFSSGDLNVWDDLKFILMYWY